ncbi:hypothetical protein PBN151_3315 [Paenibacillus sp. NAIST15-1]|nr:hypothetical protein PBN151_3315 [Paenibacillus sp. NAIST15-1]
MAYPSQQIVTDLYPHSLACLSAYSKITFYAVCEKTALERADRYTIYLVGLPSIQS